MMPPDDSRPRITRRTLLKAGVAGGAVLLAARWLTTDPTRTPSPGALDEPARGIVASIVPAMLSGALPAHATQPDRAQLVDAVVDNVDRAVAALPPAARKELEQLFALLAFVPSRCLLAGIWSPWNDASTESITAFLAAWRDSRFGLQRSAYGALHQLIMAAWYGSPQAWPAIGYPGPPVLESA
ncbi:MAG: hypothetical protein ABI981_08325 [Betaproteobacteria bacterium]